MCGDAPARPGRGGVADGAGPVDGQGTRIGWFDELADESGRGVTHEVRAHRAAEGVDGGGASIDEDGHIAGRSVRQGHDRDPLRHPVRQRRRIAEVENVGGVCSRFPAFVAQQHLAGRHECLVGDQDHIGPRPRFLDRTSGSPQGRRTVAQEGECASGSDGDQPGAAIVLPYRQDDREERAIRPDRGEGSVRGMPDVPVGREGETVRRGLPGFGEPEVDPRRSHADRPYRHRALRSIGEGGGQATVRGLEGMQGGERGAPGQHDAGVDGRRGEGERWIRLFGGDLTQEPVAAGAARQCGAGESADPQSGQLGQVQIAPVRVLRAPRCGSAPAPRHEKAEPGGRRNGRCRRGR